MPIPLSDVEPEDSDVRNYLYKHIFTLHTNSPTGFLGWVTNSDIWNSQELWQQYEAFKRIINEKLIKMRHVMQQLRSQRRGSTHAFRSNPTSVPSSPSYDMVDNMHFLPRSIVHPLFIKQYLTLLSVNLHMKFLLCKVCRISFSMKIEYIFIFMMILLNIVAITLVDDDDIIEEALTLRAMIVPPSRRSARTHRVRRMV